MQPNIRVMLFDEDGERFFGEGPCRLLHAIEQTGSLRAAAQSMQMAYTKALGLVRHAEQVDRKSTRLNSSHARLSRMPSSA